MASNYGQFGKPFKGFRQEDPVDACMPDRFLDAPWNYNLGNCKQFMAQRCSQKWDNKCQLYVNNIQWEEEQKITSIFKGEVKKIGEEIDVVCIDKL